MTLQVCRIHPFDGIRHARMQPLPARQRQRLSQRLAYELVYEAVPSVPARWFGPYDVRALRFFNGIERRIRLLALQLFEQPQAEASSNHGSRGEYAASIFSKAFQPSA